MKATWIACLLLMIAPVWLGCAHETTVTTTTSSCVEHQSDYESDSESDSESDYKSDYKSDHDSEYATCDRVIEEVVVETERNSCHGLLSCTFVVVGEVIALPFRIVGAAFDVIL